MGTVSAHTRKYLGVVSSCNVPVTPSHEILKQPSRSLRAVLQIFLPFPPPPFLPPFPCFLLVVPPCSYYFSCFSLDDVLEFRVFANSLGFPGAEQLTVRVLIENDDIQADPYSQALLQELTKSGVLQWNQALSLDDLMQARAYSL